MIMRTHVQILAFWWLVGGLGWTGCTRRVVAEPIPPTVAAPVPPAAGKARANTLPATARVRLASLRRTPCFGACPVFGVDVWSDGQVTWLGERHVARLGAYTAQAPPGWVAALLREGAQSGFFELASHYPTNGHPVPDLPQTITMLRQGDREHVVTDNADAPANLLRFERYWQEKLETLAWKPVAQ